MTDEQQRITFDPDQCGGRPCIRGMRIRVTDILEMLAGGSDRAEILEDYTSRCHKLALFERLKLKRK